ncbi:uncharacterized protein RHO25_003841 [Cercospora beticola]|uniref:Uncharacterized protein n=1 Tax=Cercospora beticola TaxID=122368 RepID=A0ABZ0NI82_CERBT|nr:hypothetical protein RHO25_003841 [Cercospora beticola]
MINILLQGDGASVDVEDRQKATALCVAASEGAHSVVKRLLTGGASVNGSPKEGVVTPLMKACHRGESTVVHLLIDHGADVNRCHARREFPDVWDPYNFLFLRGWKPDVGSGQIQSRWTALAYACGPYVLSRIMEELSSRLLAAGADPNLGDVVPLETAIIYGDQGVTKILLDAGADPLWVSNECIETLQGVQKRTDGHLYRKRKEKWSLLQQYYPIMFGSKEYLE